nr:NADH dehydrogenase subunit 4 [Bryaninops yongei]
MLKILIPTIYMIPVACFTQPKLLWVTSVSLTTYIAGLSLLLVTPEQFQWWCANSYSMGYDSLSTPLVVLSCWLLPLTILCSKTYVKKQYIDLQRMYIVLLLALQVSLIMAFTATEFTMFYIMFESTLLPTVFLISRWGNLWERLKAGNYLLFYTLLGSLPLLIGLIWLNDLRGTTSLAIISFSPMFLITSVAEKLWWLSCLLAFAVKTPIYGTHLWLPKAHVEAPIAGSMVLAGVMLKLGGYGMIRAIYFLHPFPQELAYPFMVFALWGAIMTGLTCLRQEDIKSVIAYSSVGHMGLVTGGILTQTSWGLTGAMVMMISHGLTSSALFVLANTMYERTHTRTMKLNKGYQPVLAVFTTWWLLAITSNFGLPPLPSFLSEALILPALLEWSQTTMMVSLVAAVITVLASLYIFVTTQWGPNRPYYLFVYPPLTKEHYSLLMHFAPLVLLILVPDIVSRWNL